MYSYFLILHVIKNYLCRNFVCAKVHNCIPAKIKSTNFESCPTNGAL